MATTEWAVEYDRKFDGQSQASKFREDRPKNKDEAIAWAEWIEVQEGVTDVKVLSRTVSAWEEVDRG